MKTILYLAITANGLITKDREDTSYVSAASWKSFSKLCGQAGNIIMGRRTFEAELKDKNFPYKKRLNVVMTKKSVKNRWGEDVLFTRLSPVKVIKLLGSRGFKTAFVAGGSKLATSFIKQGLIDELILDIEPTISGRGMPLFQPANFDLELKLIGTKKLSNNTIQLRYRVVA